jgi:hypothetical protein
MKIKTIEDILIKGVHTAKNTVCDIEDAIAKELIRHKRAIPEMAKGTTEETPPKSA